MKVDLCNTDSVKYGSTNINSITKGAEQIWPLDSEFYLLYDSAYWLVTSIQGDQYIKEKVSSLYELCGLTSNVVRFNTGIYPDDYTEFEIYFTLMKSEGGRSLYNDYHDKSNGMSVFTLGHNTTSGALYFDYGAANSGGTWSSGSAARIILNTNISLTNDQFSTVFVLKCGRSQTFNNQKKYTILTDVDNSFTYQQLNGGGYGIYDSGHNNAYVLKIGNTNANTDFRFYRIKITQSGVLAGDFYWDTSGGGTPVLMNAVTKSSVPFYQGESAASSYITHYSGHSLAMDGSVSKNVYSISGTITDGGKTYDRLVNLNDNTIIRKGAEIIL